MNVWQELNSTKLDQQHIDETAAQVPSWILHNSRSARITKLQQERLFNIGKVLAQSVFRSDGSC